MIKEKLTGEEVTAGFEDLGFLKNFSAGHVFPSGKIQKTDHYQRMPFEYENTLEADYNPQTGEIILAAQIIEPDYSNIPSELKSSLDAFFRKVERDSQKKLQEMIGTECIEIQLSAPLSRRIKLTITGSEPKEVYHQMLEVMRKSKEPDLEYFAEILEEGVKSAKHDVQRSKMITSDNKKWYVKE